MLTEYALTPHVFDPQHNAADPEWLGQLRAFCARLLPAGRNRIHNNVVSDLCDGHWFAKEIVPMIDALQQEQVQDPNKRIPALDLLKSMRHHIEDRLVTRAFAGDNWPSDENSWAREAVASSTMTGLPIHRIVTSGGLTTNEHWRSLGEAAGEDFWEPIPTTHSPPSDLTEQIDLLRRMTAFYSFLSFRSPHISGVGSGKDLPFAIALIKAALNRPPSFSVLERFDLHTRGKADSGAERDNQAKAILDRLQEEIGPGIAKVRLFLWRKFTERNLIVGHFHGTDRPRTIWAVSMSHVAQPNNDFPDGDQPTFAVLSQAATSRLASRLYTKPQDEVYSDKPYRRIP